MEQNKKNELVERACYKCQLIYPDGTKSCIFECPNKKSLRRRMSDLESFLISVFIEDGWSDCDIVRTEFVESSQLIESPHYIQVFLIKVRGFRLRPDNSVLFSSFGSVISWL